LQFDLFSHLNTDDTVRRIKEILSQYSISQRLFGEAVLGLSQVREPGTQSTSQYSINQRLNGEAVMGLSQVRDPGTPSTSQYYISQKLYTVRLCWGCLRLEIP
jgi:hypothetical protein